MFANSLIAFDDNALAPRGKDDCRQRKLRFMLAERVSVPLFLSGTAFYVKMNVMEKNTA
jgi:hypothetical protein